MKVMCIKKDVPVQPHPDLIRAANAIQVGGVYTVVNEEGNKYELEEFPHPLQILWDKDLFAPLSDIDEKQFERNYNKELA